MARADRQSTALTLEQAAELLSVSPGLVVKLLDERRILAHGVGNRRTVMLQDLLDYKDHDDARREEAADELTREAERLGLDY